MRWARHTVRDAAGGELGVVMAIPGRWSVDDPLVLGGNWYRVVEVNSVTGDADGVVAVLTVAGAPPGVSPAPEERGAEGDDTRADDVGEVNAVGVGDRGDDAVERAHVEPDDQHARPDQGDSEIPQQGRGG